MNKKTSNFKIGEKFFFILDDKMQEGTIEEIIFKENKNYLKMKLLTDAKNLFYHLVHVSKVYKKFNFEKGVYIKEYYSTLY